MKEKNAKRETADRDYWELARKVSKEVAEWPEWKKNIDVGYSYSTNSDLSLAHYANGRAQQKKINKY